MTPMQTRRLTTIAATLAAIVIFTTYPIAQGKVDITGKWIFTVQTDAGTGTPTVTFKQDGEKISGTYDGRYGPSPLEGMVKDNKIEFTVSMTAEGAAVTGGFSGTVDGDAMNGSVEFDGAGDGTWSAVRVPDK
jgi:hypothetical protein